MSTREPPKQADKAISGAAKGGDAPDRPSKSPLGEALRANLRRRKAQTRARSHSPLERMEPLRGGESAGGGSEKIGE